MENPWKIVTEIWHEVCFVWQYGPDLIHLSSNDTPFEKIVPEALEKWIQEGAFLLPRRYRLILNQLLEENVISEETYKEYSEEIRPRIRLEEGSVIVVDGKLEGKFHHTEPRFPWRNSEKVLAEPSDPLRNKVVQFEDDWSKFTKSTKGGLSLLDEFTEDEEDLPSSKRHNQLRRRTL